MRKSINYDSFQSAITKLGKEGYDKKTSISYEISSSELLNRESIEALYYGDGISAKVVDVLPEEMMRKPPVIVIRDQPEQSLKVSNYLKKLGVYRTLLSALKWARLYGGAGIVMGLDDSQMADMPVNPHILRDVRWLNVLNRHELIPDALDTDPLSATFGQPKHFILAPDIGGMKARTAKVHRSRVLVISGVPLPASIANKYEQNSSSVWGASILQRCYGPIRNLGSSYDNIATIIQEYNLSVFQIDNLAEMLSSEDGEKQVLARLELMNRAKSTVNALVLMNGEHFEWKNVNLSGLADQLHNFMLHVSAVSNIPVTRLMGQSPSGLNATGESDTRNWYDYIASQQEALLREPLEQLVRYVFRSRLGPTGGVEPDDWAIEFPPLRELTEMEEATIRQMQSQADGTYLTNNVVTPEEVAQSRFGKGKWSGETHLNTELRELMAAPASEDDMAAAERPPVGEDLVSSGEAARKMGMKTPSAIMALYAAGKIRGWKVGNRHKFLMSEIYKAAASPSTAPITEPPPADELDDPEDYEE